MARPKIFQPDPSVIKDSNPNACRYKSLYHELGIYQELIMMLVLSTVAL
jgi:hypothetical protein